MKSYSKQHRQGNKVMKTFNFPIINDTTPMNQDNFFKWLQDQPERKTRKVDSVCEYLDSLGFVTGEHKIEESDFKRLEYIFEHYYNVWKPFKNVMKFTDLFEPTNEPLTTYENQDKFNPVFEFTEYSKLPTGRYKVKSNIIEILNKYYSLVYPLNSWNNYFEVVKTCSGDLQLFIKYQQIIGSRRICSIQL